MTAELDTEEAFEGYMHQVYPRGVPQLQYAECKRAFYAGMHQILCHMLTQMDVRPREAELERLLALTMVFADRVGLGIGEN